MIHAKLLEFQRIDIRIKKDSVATLGGGRNYRYASLPAVLAAVRPVLTDVGLVFTQSFADEHLETRIVDPHTGESVVSTVPMNYSGSWHEIWAAVTYLRRYAIITLLGLAADEDTDAFEETPKTNGHSSNGHGHGHADDAPDCPVCGNNGIKSKYGGGYYCGRCRRPYETADK